MRGGNIKKNILLISSLMPVFSKITFANVFETLGGVVTNAAIKYFKVPHFIPGPAIPISIRVCKSIFSSIRIYINNRKK
ncbi:MAG: hypothetical protein QXR03_04530 [Candidatus Aenigmatarchaeota archaeon]